MKFAKERANVICSQLRNNATLQKKNITNWKVKEGKFIDVKMADESELPWKEFDTNKDRWYGPDKHYWFRTVATVPEEFDGKPLWMRIHTGLSDWDDGQNPQFLLFINGEVIQGCDINHREVFITSSAKAGESYQIDIQSYTGTLHSEFHFIVDFEEIDPKIQALYFDLQVPIWGLNRMNEDNKIRLDLETEITNTINLIDLRKVYSKEYYESIEKASAYIKKHIYEDMAGFDDVIATCIGHTHIDVAWLWTVDQVRQKSCRSFATVLKLMDEYPNYKFMSSQPQLYKFVKERHPEVYQKIKDRVAEGRWEPEGGMWVEADCNLTSGESLVRQFLYGKRFFKEEFGVDNRVLWLPDVFGYSAALPQIMKKCGIDYFMTTKLAWNEFNKVPYDTMNWEGIDGSQIFTHLITTLGVGQNVENFFTTYNGMLHPDAIMGGWERYQQKDMNNDILISYGFGDGGGGPTRTMLETSKRMEKGIKGIPKVRQEFSRTYFDELHERVKDNKRLPSWVGELYFEYHRGTYTSMGRNKRANRKSEFGMMELELFSVLALANGMSYPKEEMDGMWELILRNQFHDILPGSSIHEVYEVTKKEYEEIAAKTKQLMEERMNTLLTNGEGITVFNTLGYERNDVVLLGDVKADAVTDGKEVFPVQQTKDGAVAFIQGMPSKGYLSLTTCEKKAKTPFTTTKDSIETPFYSVKFDAFGQMTSIYDKENLREVLQPGKLGNELRIYEDKPLSFSCWNTDIFYEEKSWQVNDVVSMEWTEVGPVRATLEIERNVMDTVIRQKIHFYGEDRRIDFDTYVDWKFNEHLLKVHFPVDVHTDEATFDIQFGNLKRKIHTNTSWDVAKFETCGHKWADLSEGAYGVSLLNDCKYGHSMKHNVMSLTLIKSGTEPNLTADQEEHFFTYSLYPHAGTWEEAQTVREAMNLNVPAKTVLKKAAVDRYSYMNVSKENVVLETIKEAEDGDGIIVRLYEVENKRTHVTLTVAKEIVSAIETNMIEEAEEVQSLKVTGNTVCFEIKPYEVKTFRLHLKQNVQKAGN